MKSYILVGGQAVIEGVMMRVPGAYATAVRLKNNTIVYKKHSFTSIIDKRKLQNVYFDSKNLTSNIINISEIVIFIDANVVIDAFILNKKIVALDYIYMNTLYFNNFDEINFIRNRDEFYELFKPSNIKNIKKIGNDSISLNKILPFQNITLQSILNEK